ncbi:hypothetical protein IDAT_06290 [Pseudidiomarina atlantica]|uniref:Tll0287-like domain-containing protein n=1 Tax=Pseudidiomarina atlantica TaxID=1517416 RepID=A0A094L2F7_9GAMM|nr:DUF3365 domain-containing protein [Pseudidiomarina atlantica]KFZ28808.1 hypothetical protein IDAT_06290 [Pseudidiomarina atlantica]
MNKFGLILMAVVMGAGVQAGESDERMERSRELSQQLQQQLGAKLMAAMKAEGPVHAIDVCHLEAPLIGEQVSTAGEVDVRRTALRYRNPANAPTEQQIAVMEQFAAQLQDAPSQIPETMIKLDNGEQHYMRAIVMQPQCAACHGGSVQEPVLRAIADKYPNDQATGFEVGDLRGAFLVKWMSEE